MIALVRTELIKAVHRVRTLVILITLIGLPVLIVTAIRDRGSRPPRADGSIGLFRLGYESGLLVPAGVLSMLSTFLLVVIAGLLAGDSVAGDASSGNLRYLLLRPVSRVRLLVAKAAVAGFLIWCCVILVTVIALIAGVVAFGRGGIVVPARPALDQNPAIGSFVLSERTILLRVAFATAYVALGLTALLAIGVFFSVVTDSASGAIGAAIATYIVSQILAAIPELGRIRYGLPTYYNGYWKRLFLWNEFPDELWAGLVSQGIYLVVFGTAALVWFSRKDIRC
jgi:ABC-2 type transport system permease protein